MSVCELFFPHPQSLLMRPGEPSLIGLVRALDTARKHAYSG